MGQAVFKMSNAREALIQVLFPLFYEVSPRKACSSYAMKHDLEYGFFPHTPEIRSKFYFSNTETIAALVALGVPHTVGEPNYGFKIKDKFPTTWVRNLNPTRRPKYAKVREWEAYLDARREMDAILAEMGTEPNLYQRVTDQVGHEGEPKAEIPLCLRRRLPLPPPHPNQTYCSECGMPNGTRGGLCDVCEED